MKKLIVLCALVAIAACNNAADKSNPAAYTAVQAYRVPGRSVSYWYAIVKNGTWFYTSAADSLTSATQVTGWTHSTSEPSQLLAIGVEQLPNDTVNVSDLPQNLQTALGY